MTLPSNQLEAFYETAQTLSFSRAAKNLHITQSALSQRVINLEAHLGLSLFIRDSAGIRLTDAGETLLRHCQVRNSLEQELLNELKMPTREGIGGTLRIGGFSSVMWSVIAPALGPLVRDNPEIHVEILAREMADLPNLLRIGEIDFAIVDHKIERADLEVHLLGIEENVLVQPAKKNKRLDCYLDHDMEDQATVAFFKQQGQRKVKLNRSFVDDIHGLLAGVSNGWGSAVIPRHLIKQCKSVQVVDDLKPLEIPLYLHYYSQPYYSALHNKVIETLVSETKRFLEAR